MNIGIFTNNYLPRVNGVAHSVEGFKQELVKRGDKVFVFAPKYHNNHHEKKTFRFRSLRAPKQWQNDYYPVPPIPFTYSSKIKKIVQRLNLDIIHAQQPYLLGKTAQRYAQELNIPLVFTNHTPYYQYLKYLPSTFEEFLNPLLISLVTDYANKCQFIIVPTRIMKQLLLRAGVKTPVKVIPSGIDLVQFQKQNRSKEIRQRYRLKQSDILLVLVTRLSCEKNIGFLLEVFQKIIKKRNDIYLMIVGGGLQSNILKQTADSLCLKNKVIFTGQINYQKLPCYYGAGDLFVYPSLIDSQSLALVEAMAAGLPVVAIKETIGSGSMVCHNKTGFLVSNFKEQFTKAVMKLINNEPLRQKFSQAAQKQSQQYSVQSSTDKLLTVYQEAIRIKKLL